MSENASLDVYNERLFYFIKDTLVDMREIRDLEAAVREFIDDNITFILDVYDSARADEADSAYEDGRAQGYAEAMEEGQR